MLKPIVGVLFVAAVATFGDWYWYTTGVQHRMTAGAIHGALLLGAVGLVLGWIAGRIPHGLAAGVGAGMAGALAFYAIAAAAGRGSTIIAMVAAWAAVWLMLAVLDGRWLRSRPPRSWGEIMTRGAAAAILGGIAFYLLVDVLWGHDRETGKNYVVQYFAWVFAWAPGILALTARRTLS